MALHLIKEVKYELRAREERGEYVFQDTVGYIDEDELQDIIRQYKPESTEEDYNTLN